MLNYKKDAFKVTKKMCAKVYPYIKPGDIIEVSFTREPVPGRYVLISEFEEQWIEKYNRNMKKKNIYPVTKIIMTS